MRTVQRILILLGVLTSPLMAQAPVEVPLTVRGGRLLVSVKAGDGTALEFVLSTGSAVTVLSESGAAHAEDAGGFTLGGLPVPMEGAVTLEDEKLTIGGRVVGGMISSNMLNQFDALIDVPHARLVLKPIGRSVEWEGMTLSEPVRLRIFHGIAIGLDVELNGHAYPAMLEIGTPSLIVNEGARVEAGLETEDSGTLTVGTLQFPDLPVRTEDLEVIRRFSPNGDGFVLVGAPLAYDCAISISFVHQELRTCVR